MHRLSIAALTTILLIFNSQLAHANWIAGDFASAGKPVEEHHCVPAGSGPHPAIVLLHGASPKIGLGDAAFEQMCTDLAAQGYYTEFIEYYSQTGAVGAGRPLMIKQEFPIWLAEIKSGIDDLDKNAAVDPHRVAMMGFSLGAFLSLSIAAADPSQVAAVVEYYGGLPPRLQPMAKTMPPTLILHGDKDTIVPVSQAHELDQLLTQNNRPHEIKIYEGAEHAFNFEGLPFWYRADYARDAWERTLKFLAANLHPTLTK
ncbi:MAG: dienelactone hydrolase family protein [Candidatus Binatus sp.]|uniref:dienelactone hydrolase family protein n=1 Tax=Candidatus Binatus sp. TaxID=2811406 RepID=UPI002718475F|nr:dienelactone hydrolase family protein [Candidatus Binatus sp.]MDO8434919.1 dienelactone hydrolase family protein [Candidatus Binatus sp.]